MGVASGHAGCPEPRKPCLQRSCSTPVLEHMMAAAGPGDHEAAHARHEHDPLRGHQHTLGDAARHTVPAGAEVALSVRQHILHQNR